MKRLFIFFVLCEFVHPENYLYKTDQLLSETLEGKNHSAFLDLTMETLALSTPFIEFGYAGVLQLESKKAQLLTVSTLGVQLPIAIGKYIFKRNRPNRHYTPRLWNSRWTSSFPSGHGATTAAWATTLILSSPKMKPLLIGYTLVSGYSQVYVGNHYISDILAGWMLGWATARIIQYSFEPSRNKSVSSPLLRIAVPL